MMMSKRGPKPRVYEWRGKIYIGQAAVAKAAGVTPPTVSALLHKHGNLDRLGTGRQNNWPKDGRGARRVPVARFGRSWGSATDLAREARRPLSTILYWLKHGHDDRLLAALMAADARRTAAAMREAQMIDTIRKDAA